MALRITLIYAVVSGLWILLSDRMLFTMVQDRQVASHLSTYKGWVFVAVTGWMLYALIRSMFAQVAKSQEEAAEAKRQFYRGTVYSVTDGKLDLCSRGEISAQMPDDMETVNISSEADLAKLRDRVKQLAQSKCMPDDQTHSFVTAVGEAAANAVKHAGEGTACLAGRDGKVQVCIQDKGPGIDTLTLPKATLMKRYSTAKSLGLGYSLILASVDSLYLATDDQGTWVLMEKSPSEPPPELNLDSLPDTW